MDWLQAYSDQLGRMHGSFDGKQYVDNYLEKCG